MVENDIFGVGSEPVVETEEVVEGLLVRGLSTDRKANGSPSDYHFWNDNEYMVE